MQMKVNISSAKTGQGDAVFGNQTTRCIVKGYASKYVCLAMWAELHSNVAPGKIADATTREF